MEIASFVIASAQSIVQALQTVQQNEVEAKALSVRIVTIADLVDQWRQRYSDDVIPLPDTSASKTTVAATPVLLALQVTMVQIQDWVSVSCSASKDNDNNTKLTPVVKGDEENKTMKLLHANNDKELLVAFDRTLSTHMDAFSLLGITNIQTSVATMSSEMRSLWTCLQTEQHAFLQQLGARQTTTNNNNSISGAGGGGSSSMTQASQWDLQGAITQLETIRCLVGEETHSAKLDHAGMTERNKTETDPSLSDASVAMPALPMIHVLPASGSDSVMAHEWSPPRKEDGSIDFGLVIQGSLAEWRKENSSSKVANISDRRDLQDSDFVSLQGIKALNMSRCRQSTITDKAFESLRGIHTLDMSWCTQSTITDKAFESLRGIHTLKVTCCTQSTITDKAFESLVGIHTLDMRGCSQSTITDKAFESLRGIHTLKMTCCTQSTITDKAFESLRGIHTLHMRGCSQSTITGKAFESLRGIHTLDTMRVSIRSKENGRVRFFPLDVESSDTFENVMQRIERMHAIPANEQRMVFGGKMPGDHDTLRECNVQNGSIIFLIKCRGDIGVYVSAIESHPSTPLIQAGEAPGAIWLSEPAFPDTTNSIYPSPKDITDLLQTVTSVRTTAFQVSRSNRRVPRGVHVDNMNETFSSNLDLKSYYNAVFHSTSGVVSLSACDALVQRVNAEWAMAASRVTTSKVCCSDAHTQLKEILMNDASHCVTTMATATSPLALNVIAGSTFADFRTLLSHADLVKTVGEAAVSSIANALDGSDRLATSDVIALRRTTATGRWIGWHTDEAFRTVQVPLSSDSECVGGKLLFLASDGQVRQPTRVTGGIIAHYGDVVHGVTRLDEGVRYGLYALRGREGEV